MGSDILILTVYFICVTYVIYQMALSLEAQLEDQVNIRLDSDLLLAEVENQLEQQRRYPLEAQIMAGSKGGPSSLSLVFQPHSPAEKKPPSSVINLLVMPQGTRPLQPPVPAFTVQVQNQGRDLQLYLDWDRSSISRFNNQGKRVIRLIPGMPQDLGQPQVFSVVNGGQALSCIITFEEAFVRNANGLMEAKVPLVDLEKATEMKPSQQTFSLMMLLWLKRTVDGDDQAIRLLVPFRFNIEVLPGKVALPVLSWLLDR